MSDRLRQAVKRKEPLLVVESLVHAAAQEPGFAARASYILESALENNDRPVAELLIGAGASTASPRLVATAAQYGNLRLLELVLPLATPAQIKDDSGGRTPLAWALKADKEEEEPGDRAAAARLLLAAGADPDLGTVSTPLHELAKRGDAELIAELLAAGARPDVPVGPPAGWTPLHVAALYDSVGAVRALVAAGVSPGAADVTGRTPLHVAARNLNPGAARALLAAGADPLAVNVEGQTPLQFLAQRTDRRGTPSYQDGAMLLMAAAGAGDAWELVFGDGEAVPGLERALVPLMRRAPGQLPELFRRLTPGAKEGVRAVLLRAHRHGLDNELREAVLLAVTGA